MARYQNIVKIDQTDNGKRYYTSAIPSDIPYEQIKYTQIARMGDRWDTIAFKYLGSAALWYVVARANKGLNGSMFIKPGTKITIPKVV